MFKGLFLKVLDPKYFNVSIQLNSCRHVSGYKRPPFFPVERKSDEVHLFYSLEERLAEKDDKILNPQLYEKVNIGLAFTRKKKENFKDRTRLLKQNNNSSELRKKSRNCELLIDLDKADEDWEMQDKPLHIKAIAENNKIYDHLFGEFAYFYPTIPLNINYNYDEETLSPVYFGNLLKPKETNKPPNVTIKSDPDDLWTLLLTNPDGNLYDNDSEVLHWFVGNIPGGKIDQGEEIIEYMPPIPFKGTGFHRYVFVAYKQNTKIDFSSYQKSEPCLNLRERSFKTFDFYKKFEDSITPGGLAWFQADWDASLTSYIHHVLDMKEPQYEYEFPKAYVKPPEMFPFGKPFNRYMDLHRNPKDLQKLILIKRLKGMHPFLGEDPPRPPFPQAMPLDKSLPIWIKNEIKEERDGSGKYKDLYRGDDRPIQNIKRPNTVFGWCRKYNI